MEGSDSELRDKAKGFRNRAIVGMEGIIATVSGYHGSERSKLIKLITIAGANYVGAMNRSTTHLVCWKFEGKKYELAKKCGTVIINHRWFEDCIREGILISEYRYTLKSGSQIGTITSEVPGFSNKEHVLTENSLLNKSSTRDLSKDVVDLETKGTEYDDWDILSLLDEYMFPKSGSSGNASFTRKGQLLEKDSKRRKEANSRQAVLQSQAYELGRSECYEESISSTSKRRLRRRGNSLDDGKGSTSAEPSCEYGWPVKRNAKKEYLKSAFLSANQRSYTCQVLDDDVDRATNQLNDLRDEGETRINGVADVQETRSEGFMEFAEISRLNDIGSPEHLRLHTKEAPTAPGMTSEDTYSDFSTIDMELKTEVVEEHSTKLPTQKEPSCAICYTDFSSTRGVLPCGHRFCFSCIQNWADHMVSKGKTSTCPLCKDGFVTITRVEDAAGMHQKIYSQTVPCYESTENVYFLPEDGPHRRGIQSSRGSICCSCLSGEVADLLIYCHMCNNGCIHDYCLDPPLFPWTCPSCRDRRMFF